jgi:aspartyl/asparaginyl-tRNA synthetase
MYLHYEAVTQAVQEHAATQGWRGILPAGAAPQLEFAPERSLVVGSSDRPELVLPASNTYQKEFAASIMGSVWCIAAAYRRDNFRLDRRDQLHLPIFHQIEVELPDSSLEEARSAAQELLAHVERRCRAAGSALAWSFDHCETVDLADLDEPPAHDEFDDWTVSYLAAAHGPTWVLHMPQTPPPRLNLSANRGLSRGFDLFVPDKRPLELLSGGERDLGEMSRFMGGRPGDMRGSAGFGIGLERLVMVMFGYETIHDVVLPHARPWTSQR